MGFRVDRITVTLDLYVEFEGNHTVSFSYSPPTDDELVALACKKNDELLLAAAKADDNKSSGMLS
jgi:hypothetical protein